MIQRNLINLPQLGVNDETARVVALIKPAGALVSEGEVVLVVETTKATFDVISEAAGYLVPLVDVGEVVEVGKPVAVISSEESDNREAVRLWLGAQAASVQGPNEKPYTKKALVVAERLGVNIADVTTNGPRVTEKDVLAYYNAAPALSAGRMRVGPDSPERPETVDFADTYYPSNRLQRVLILGAGNGAIQVLDALRGSSRQRPVGILDDDANLLGKTVMGVPIIGKVESALALDLTASGFFDVAVISVSTSIQFRERTYDRWKAEGLKFTNIIHPTAFIGANVEIGEGNIILAFCHIGACARIKDNNFLSAFTNIEHHSVLNSHCSFGPGVFTSSSVAIQSRVKMGTGIFIEPYVTIGSDSIVASGCIITREIPANTVVKLHDSATMSNLRK